MFVCSFVRLFKHAHTHAHAHAHARRQPLHDNQRLLRRAGVVLFRDPPQDRNLVQRHKACRNAAAAVEEEEEEVAAAVEEDEEVAAVAAAAAAVAAAVQVK